MKDDLKRSQEKQNTCLPLISMNRFINILRVVIVGHTSGKNHVTQPKHSISICNLAPIDKVVHWCYTEHAWAFCSLYSSSRLTKMILFPWQLPLFDRHGNRPSMSFVIMRKINENMCKRTRVCLLNIGSI